MDNDKFTWKAEDITLLDKDGNEIEPANNKGKEHAQQRTEETSQKEPAQASQKSTESRHLDETTGGEREPSPKA